MIINDKIVEIAKRYIGQQEIRGNKGFVDLDFQSKIGEMGWEVGQAWCMYFCELVWKEAYSDYDGMVDFLDKLFSAGAVKTFNNFKCSDFMISRDPVPGAIIIWQTYKNGGFYWTGHGGIYISPMNASYFHTVEGNTNASGGREGIEVANKVRVLDFDIRAGLVLRGFIYPI